MAVPARALAASKPTGVVAGGASGDRRAHFRLPFSSIGRSPSVNAARDAATRRAVLACAATTDVTSLKAQLLAASGSANGTDLDEAAAAAVKQVLSALEAANTEPAPANVDLAGTSWELLYTNSSGNSSGKIGPFIGKVEQIFPSDDIGRYINAVQIGPLRAELTASYTAPRDDKLDVVFVDTAVKLFSIELLRKEFDDSKGFWKLTYIDDDLRILYTNAGNVFVLTKA